MQVSVDSLLHKLWQFTFLSDEKPRRTTKWRFLLRVILLPIPAAIVLVLFFVLWVVLTLTGNLMTILSGTGIFVTWGNGSVYVDEFDRLPIRDYEIPSQLVAALLWACVGLGLLWYHYPAGFMMYGLMTVKVVFIIAIIGAASFWAIDFADEAEDNDSDRIRDIVSAAIAKKEEVPDEVVIFVHPPVRVEKMTGA